MHLEHDPQELLEIDFPGLKPVIRATLAADVLLGRVQGLVEPLRFGLAQVPQRSYRRSDERRIAFQESDLRPDRKEPERLVGVGKERVAERVMPASPAFPLEALFPRGPFLVGQGVGRPDFFLSLHSDFGMGPLRPLFPRSPGLLTLLLKGPGTARHRLVSAPDFPECSKDEDSSFAK